MHPYTYKRRVHHYPMNVYEYFRFLVGTWVGGGVFELSQPEEFKTNTD